MNDAIVGRRGLGKSTLAYHIADSLNKNKLVFDTNNQFKSATRRTSDIHQVQDWMKASQRWEEPIYLAYIPQGDVEEEWNRFSDVIWPYGDYSLIIDEAHRLQKPQYVNQNLDRLMRQAPRRERGDENPIDTIQCFHRPVDMNGIVLSLLDYIYYFRVTKSRDLEYIEKEFDEPIRKQVETLRTPPDGRDVLRVNVEENSSFLLTDSSEWYTVIREQPKKPSNAFAISSL